MNNNATITGIKLSENNNTSLNQASLSSANNYPQQFIEAPSDDLIIFDTNEYSKTSNLTPDLRTHKRVGATIAAVGSSLVEGLGEFGEALVDAEILSATAYRTVISGIATDATMAAYHAGKGVINAIKSNEMF